MIIPYANSNSWHITISIQQYFLKGMKTGGTYMTTQREFLFKGHDQLKISQPIAVIFMVESNY